MKNKNILNIIIVLAVVVWAVWYTTSQKPVVPEQDSGRIGSPIQDEVSPNGKLKAEVFSGRLEEVNEGCFADAECYVVVSGKHVTVIMGWSRETVGQVLGVETFADLNAHIGEEMEVYAQDKGDGTYTLYGSEGFYVKLK